MRPVDLPETDIGQGPGSATHFPHVDADGVSSSSDPSSPSSHSQVLASRRQSSTGHTYAQLLGRNKGKSAAYPSSSSAPFPDPERHRRPRESKPHSKTQSRSTSSSSRTLDRFFILATERIAESTRANNAEAQLKTTMALLRTARAERDQALASVSALKTQLTLYQDQLARAQSEIIRAQGIVDGVERAKVEALEDAARARSKARRLEEATIVREAQDAGRKRGFQEGLQRGRMIARVAGWGDDFEEDDEMEDDELDPEDSRSMQGTRTGPVEATRSGVETRRTARQPAQVAQPEPLPIPNLSPPAPLRIPSTRPQSRARTPTEHTVRPVARSEVSDQGSYRSQPGPSGTRARSGSQPRFDTADQAFSSRTRKQSNLASTPVPVPSRSPESIRPIHPVIREQEPVRLTDEIRASVRERIPSPTPSRRSLSAMAMPPDGFIPTLDSESAFISLPPPYELSQTPRNMDTRPLDLASLPEDGRTSRAGNENRSKAKQRERDQEPAGSERRRPSSRGTRTTNYPPGRAGTMSTEALSEYDILSPPDTGNRVPGHAGEGQPADGYFAEMQDEYVRQQEVYAQRTPQTPTIAPGRRAEGRDRTDGWQSRSRDAMTAQAYNGVEDSRPVPITQRENTAESAQSPEHAGDAAHPESSRRPSYPNPNAARSPPRGPRRPREIVLPQPLSFSAIAGPSNQTLYPSGHGSGANIYTNGHYPQQDIPFPSMTPPVDGRPKTPFDWLKRQFNRTRSSPTVPQISIEPPSQSPSGHSQDDGLDPILLTPENAPADLMQPYLDNVSQIRAMQEPVITHSPMGRAIVLPSDELPPGFIHLSTTPLQQGNPLAVSSHQAYAKGNKPSSPKVIYEEAPIPPGIRYPDPPVPRPETSSGMRSTPSDPSQEDSGSRRARKRSTSPAPLNRPISLFSNDS